MKTVRPKSPAAPSHSLDEALRKADQIYKEVEDQPVMSVDAAAKAMGYTKAKNGPAGYALATLKMFGLLESRGPGRVALSESFRCYRLASNPQTRHPWLVQFLN